MHTTLKLQRENCCFFFMRSSFCHEKSLAVYFQRKYFDFQLLEQENTISHYFQWGGTMAKSVSWRRSSRRRRGWRRSINQSINQTINTNLILKTFCIIQFMDRGPCRRYRRRRNLHCRAWLSERLRRWSNTPDVVGLIPVTATFFLISCDYNQVPL